MASKESWNDLSGLIKNQTSNLLKNQQLRLSWLLTCLSYSVFSEMWDLHCTLWF